MLAESCIASYFEACDKENRLAGLTNFTVPNVFQRLVPSCERQIDVATSRSPINGFRFSSNAELLSRL